MSQIFEVPNFEPDQSDTCHLVFGGEQQDSMVKCEVCDGHGGWIEWMIEDGMPPEQGYDIDVVCETCDGKGYV